MNSSRCAIRIDDATRGSIGFGPAIVLNSAPADARSSDIIVANFLSIKTYPWICFDYIPIEISISRIALSFSLDTMIRSPDTTHAFQSRLNALPSSAYVLRVDTVVVRSRLSGYCQLKNSSSLGSGVQGGGSWHRVFFVCFARLAPAPYSILLTDAPPAALLARTPSSIVLKDASVCPLSNGCFPDASLPKTT